MVLEPRPQSRRHGPDCGLVALLVSGRPAWSPHLRWGQEVGHQPGAPASSCLVWPSVCDQAGCLHQDILGPGCAPRGSRSPALPCLPGSRQTLPMGLRPAHSSH